MVWLTQSRRNDVAIHLLLTRTSPHYWVQVECLTVRMCLVLGASSKPWHVTVTLDYGLVIRVIHRTCWISNRLYSIYQSVVILISMHLCNVVLSLWVALSLPCLVLRPHRQGLWRFFSKHGILGDMPWDPYGRLVWDALLVYVGACVIDFHFALS